ncbi:SulP family inorganic anion transporter [Vibrio viridaestus]|uniref:SulP family inorganic anion transporter n=1 Tax=Vibrio viridaestus TaxID=2487322 RepID=A0A3N9U084_9VIBR|nr:SulP family inorganic anion transporter [Vibrio viridaestus]RQW62642.1 SulP family inorganic anion transporter [Vibrio viridaestus]
MIQAHWFPWINQVNRDSLKADLFAALTGASLAIPQGIAFAAIAGLPPQYGFYCAIVAPIITVLLGSSWHMVCGPTTAISALLYSALHDQFPVGSDIYIQAVITLTFIAGIIQLILALGGFGIVSQFVSHSVMAGFITGAAILIIFSQLDSALQIKANRPDNLFHYFLELPDHLVLTNHYALAVSVVTVCSALLIKYLNRRLPHYLLALILGALFSTYINRDGGNVVTLERLPSMIPSFSLPNLSTGLVGDIFPSALAIALVGLLEATSIAKAISLKTNQKIQVNREFLGQGVSNLIGSFFSSYMSSGSFTRSGINVESGAKTPIAVILMSLFLVGLLPIVAPIFIYVPVASIASIIMLVGWRLFAFKEIKHYWRHSKQETAVLWVTLIGTLCFSMEIGLYIGVSLSICLFLKRSMQPVVKTIAPMSNEQGRFFHNAKRYELNTCPQVHFFSIEGAVFFGSLEHIEQKMVSLIRREGEKPYWIINGNDMTDFDEHGIHFLNSMIERHKASGGNVAWIMRSRWKLDKCEQYKLFDAIGKENVYPAKQGALGAIIPTLDIGVCEQCQCPIFTECPKKRSFRANQ